jgi:hypothetical protein
VVDRSFGSAVVLSRDIAGQQLRGVPVPSVSSRGVALFLDVCPGNQHRVIGSADPPRPWHVCSSVDELCRTSRSSWLPCVRSAVKLCGQSILEVESPSEYDHCRRPCRCMLHGASPEVFGSFSTTHQSSPPTRVCLTRFVPPPGFRTLLTAYSSTG